MLQAYSPEALVLHGKNFAAAKLATSFAVPAAAGAPAAGGAAVPFAAGPARDAAPGGGGKAGTALMRGDTAGEQPMVM